MPVDITMTTGHPSNVIEVEEEVEGEELTSSDLEELEKISRASVKFLAVRSSC